MDANTLAVSPHYIDPDLILQILQWKRTCETTHGSVCNTRYSEYMSKQLQTINLVDVETLSLVTTSSSTKFVALSYVWGSIPMFKTQTSNIPTNPNGAPGATAWVSWVALLAPGSGG